MDIKCASELVDFSTFWSIDEFAARGIKPDFGELLDVEKIGAAEVFVALGVVRVETVCKDDHLELGIRRVGLIDQVLAADVAEHAVGIAEAGVGSAENDRRVFRVNLIKICPERGRRDEEECEHWQPGSEIWANHGMSFH